jgi:serine/threonine protein phosphatase PrpC
MEKSIRAGDVADAAEVHGKSGFCEYAATVRKGHAECGDSAFVHCDADNIVAGVLDGVSGEPGASFASSDAAEAILAHLKSLRKPSQGAMEEALIKAHLAIRIGFTTATVLHMHRDGSFVIASIGDSPIFGVAPGAKASLEVPLDRAVKDGDSVLKYFHYRNMVTCVLGGQMELHAHMLAGRLKEGHMLILASDGISDNLFVKVHNGYVSDSTGTDDILAIIGSRCSAAAVAGALADAAQERMRGRKAEEPGRMIVPKDDDIAIIAVRKT